MVNSPNSLWADRYYQWYITAEDVAAARWLRSYGAPERPICFDLDSMLRELNSYGGYPRQHGPYLAGNYPLCTFATSYAYLNVENAIYGVETAPAQYTMTSRSLEPAIPILLSENRIYSDGAVIYEGF